MRQRRLGLAIAVAAIGFTGCGSRTIPTVQAHHGHEFRCDRRYVRVEHAQGNRWVSRGCGFEADWECRGGECTLLDSRSHGMAAP